MLVSHEEAATDDETAADGEQSKEVLVSRAEMPRFAPMKLKQSLFTSKAVIALAEKHGKVRFSYEFGKDRFKSFLLTFDLAESAAKFVNSSPCIPDCEDITVSYYTKAEPLYFEHEYDASSYINPDCLALIFQYIDYNELITHVSLTCKYWYNTVNKSRKHLGMMSTFRRLDGILEEAPYDRWFINIIKRTNLTSLDLSRTQITEECVKAITDHCPGSLKRLTFSPKEYVMPWERPRSGLVESVGEHGARIIFRDRVAKSFFSEIPNLTFLDMDDASCLSENILQIILSNCKFLEHLNVSKTRITGKCFSKHLPSSMRHLDISETQCGKKDLLATISRRCPDLELLNISHLWTAMFPEGCHYTDLPELEVMSSLKSLHMCETWGWYFGCNYNSYDGSYSDGPPSANSESIRFRYILVKTSFLESLDISGHDNLKNDTLATLNKLCPNLALLNLLDCGFKGVTNMLFTLHELRLTEFRFNACTEEESQLQKVIHGLSNFKLLKVVEILGAAFKKHHVGQIVHQLPELEQLTIELSETPISKNGNLSSKKLGQFNDDLLTLLLADPDFCSRSQVLNISIQDYKSCDIMREIDYSFPDHYGQNQRRQLKRSDKIKMQFGNKATQVWDPNHIDRELRFTDLDENWEEK